MSAPRTVAGWGNWARRQTVAHGLTERQAHLLLVLVSIGNDRGEGAASHPQLSDETAIRKRTVERVFAQLVEVGLVIRAGERRGRLRWRLNAARQPITQLSLEDAQSATQVADLTPRLADRLADPASDLADEMADQVRHPGGGQYDLYDLRGGGGGGKARVHVPASARGDLAPRFTDVLAILKPAPGLMIEPLAINSVLLAHPEPEHDHLQAAHTVAGWAHEGGLSVLLAHRLLASALARQRTEQTGQRSSPAPKARPLAGSPQRDFAKYDRAAGLA